MTRGLTLSGSGYGHRRVFSSVSDYWQLLKPKVMYLVVFTAITGISVAPGVLHPFIALVSVLCVAMGSGGAAALNMWYDSDIDAIMHRTKERPVPARRISREQALECGITLSLLSVFLMAIVVNYTSAFLLLVSILFYVIVYTVILKRRTSQNIVIGGAAGAFPPLIGWTSVTGNMPSLESFILFAIVFLWTPPHFWALAIPGRQEYKAAGIPMLPVQSIRRTQTHILGYSIVLSIVSLLPGLFSSEPALYVISVMSLNLVFLTRALAVYKEPQPSKSTCMELFSYSIYYLFLTFSIVIITS